MPSPLGLLGLKAELAAVFDAQERCLGAICSRGALPWAALPALAQARRRLTRALRHAQHLPTPVTARVFWGSDCRLLSASFCRSL